MKENKALEKIYLEKVYLDNGVLPNGLNYTQSPNDIEYTRTDTFIEKACEYLEPILTEYAGFYVGGDILQHFKKHMKEE